MNSVIGALRFVFGADTAALDKGLKDSQSNMAAFGKTVATLGAAAGAAMAAAAVKIGMSINSTIDDFDKLNKASQKVGIPVEQLSALKYAADLADVSMETLEKSVGKLSKTMVEAAAKPTSEAANAFKALGVSVTDGAGKLRGTSDVLLDVAGKFEGLKDGAGKTAVSMAIFGRAGAEMIPLLNAGKDGIKGLMDEAAKFGVVISTDTAKRAEEFNDTLKRISIIKGALIVQISAQLLPTLQKLADIWLENAKSGTLAKTVADNIGSSLLNVTQVAMSAALVWNRLGAEFKALWEFLSTDIFSGKLTENWNKFLEVGKESERMAATLRASFEDDPLGVTSKALDAIAANGPKATKTLAEFNYTAMGGKNALDQFLDSTRKSQAAQQAELQTTGLAAGAKESLKITLQGLAVAQANNIALTDQQRAALAAVAFQAGQVALQIQGQALLSQVTPIWQQYTEALNNNMMALNAVGATSAQIAAVGEATAQKFGLSWQQQSASFAGSMSEISSTFASESASMAAAAKIFGAVQALISTYAGAAEALKLPFPLNLAAVAAVTAKGLALVASIRSAVVPSAGKFATGGSFTVPGAGGLDTKRIALDVNPGEKVNVTPTKYGENSSGSGGGVWEVRGINPSSLFTGDVMRAFAERALQYQRDGGTIVFQPA